MRMVHFTEKELVWECKCRVGCECLELDRPGGINAASHKKAWFQKMLLQPMHDEFYKFWWYVLCQYSSHTFASGQDVLLAISALARRMQEHGAGQYIAGMWKNDLPHAPSWSWASRITYPHDIHAENPDFGELGPTHQIRSAIHKSDLLAIYTEILEVQAVPKSTNPFGPVLSGHVTLSGPLIQATLREKPLVINKGTKQAKTSMICPLFSDGTPVWTTMDFDPLPFEIDSGLLLLLIANELGKCRKRRYTRYKGLMLVKKKGDSNTYERIGTWEVPVLNEYNDIEAKEFFETAKWGIVQIV